MLKIFSTQLQGYFKRIMEQEEISMEEGARLLAQAVIGDGSIFVHGFQEMHGVALEAISGPEPLPSSLPLYQQDTMHEIKPIDRVLLITRFSTDEDAIQLAEELTQKGISVVAISAVLKDATGKSLVDIVDVHVDSKLSKPLIPGDDGSRFGLPTIMACLFTYYGVAFTLKDMIEEYE
ncbi:DUF2529 domain-containing protein [Bacillus timonensis]|nr:DUF2529 domain-containing protein [Bacillus timonensis]